MSANIAIEELENLKRKILQENLSKEIFEKLESLDSAIGILKGERRTSAHPNQSSVVSSPLNSTHKIVVNAVAELINQKQRSVKTSEILNYLEEKQITLGNAESKSAALASILYHEKKRPDGKIKKVRRGVYGLK